MRNQLGLLIAVCAFCSLASPVFTQQTIETVPASPAYYDKYARNVDLLCRTSKPIEQCRVRLPGLPDSYDVNSLPSGVSYYGASLPHGECGVRLAKLSADRVGKFVCLLTIGGQTHEAAIEYAIRVAPLPTELKISKHTILVDGGFRADQLLKAKCVSRLGAPAANFTWMLDGEPVDERMLKPAQITDEIQNGQHLQTVSQEINIYLDQAENGKTLVCQAAHLAFTNPQRSVLPLNVKFPPEEHPFIHVQELPASGSAMINITINANPQPVTRWLINGRVINEGESIDMYQAYIPHATSRAGQYTVLLKNNDCAEERVSVFKLEATNVLGTQTYVVKADRVDENGEIMNDIADGGSGSTFWLISVWTFFCSLLTTRLL